MLTKYTLTLQPDRPCAARPEWAYRLYAALLENAPPAFGESVHTGNTSPVGQYLEVTEDALLWHVHLLGEESEKALTEELETRPAYALKSEHLSLQVMGREKERISNVEQLLQKANRMPRKNTLQFLTAAAFKSKGHYIALPNERLILQSLMKKWNGLFSEICPIEDEDGEGFEQLYAGMQCCEYRLQSQDYWLKGNQIPGFVGEMVLENRMRGFHREIGQMLLLFGEYAGIGIKTTLGMGGIQRKPDRSN